MADSPMPAGTITLACSVHRPEVLPLAEPLMARHQAVVLEEPHSAAFDDMLRGEVGIDDYLALTDFEFPQYTRAAAARMRRLHRQGLSFFEVDPYMDELLAIHERFAEGGRPEQIVPESRQGRIYEMEKRWSGALIDYYGKALSAPFDSVVEAVKAFARADAVRGRMRDRMRAEAICHLLPRFASIYVEAGSLHLYLYTALRERLPAGYRLRIVHLLEPVVRRLGGGRVAWGPGDLLTLRYTYRPGYRAALADLLAARSLIYVKILRKEELPTSEDDFPHTRDELMCARLVQPLSYDDCRRLYAQIKTLPTEQARRVVLGRSMRRVP